MNITIVSIHDKYELFFNDSRVRSNKIIETISSKEKINKENIKIIYNDIIIKYSINEEVFTKNTILYVIIS